MYYKIHHNSLICLPSWWPSFLLSAITTPFKIGCLSPLPSCWGSLPLLVVILTLSDLTVDRAIEEEGRVGTEGGDPGSTKLTK